jgi:hypothetical protein
MNPVSEVLTDTGEELFHLANKLVARQERNADPAPGRLISPSQTAAESA